MKSIAIFLIVFFFICSAWVYATGNMPGTELRLKGTAFWVKNYLPGLSEQTNMQCSAAWKRLRRTGVLLPLSHNERMQRIVCIRKEVDIICRAILNNN